MLGSAGGPRRALPIIGGDDVLHRQRRHAHRSRSAGTRRRAHEASGALVTLALVPNREPHRYGGVSMAADGRVTGFAPRGAGAEGSFHFIGVQMAQADAFRALTGRPAGAFDRRRVRPLLTSHPGCRPRIPLRRELPRRRHDARLLGHVVRVRWATNPPRARTASACASTPTRASTRSILWDDVEVGAGAVDRGLHRDRFRQVPPGAVHRRSVLRRGDQGVLVTPL